MTFCLPKFAVTTFKQKLKGGEINPDELAQLSSEARRAKFSEIIGAENAKQVNALFESKLLLKNQQQGMINWAQKVAGLKPSVKRDMIAKVQRLSKVLEPEELDMFLDDLAEQRLGIDITVEEAGAIAQLAREVESQKSQADANGIFPSEKARIDYGLSVAEFKEYVSKLKTEAESLTVKNYVRNPLRVVPLVGNIARSVLASIDNSFVGRQGLKVLFTNPSTWASNWLKSWKSFGKQIFAKNEGGLFSNQDDAVLNAIKADVYSRPNAMNGNYDRMNIAIGLRTEEAFPTSLPGRIPVLGRLFKASETAYNGAALRMRADLADKYVKIAEKQGINLLDKKQAESLGTLINSLTGRGKINASQGGLDNVNALLFSPRFVKSNLDLLSQPFNSNLSPFARKQAAIALGKTATVVGATMFLADKLGFEIDVKKKLGQININGSWVDITGGNRSFAQLGVNIYERLKNQKGKYGEQTALDVVEGFLEGKFAPLPAAVRDVLKGRDYDGKKPTPESVLKNLGVPLPIQTYEKLDADGLGKLILMGLEIQGFSVQTPRK